MQDELRRILENISRKYDLSYKHVTRIYKSPYSLIRERWNQIDFETPDTYLKANFYIIKFGTFFVKEQRVNRIKEKLQEYARTSQG